MPKSFKDQMAAAQIEPMEPFVKSKETRGYKDVTITGVAKCPHDQYTFYGDAFVLTRAIAARGVPPMWCGNDLVPTSRAATTHKVEKSF